jgi:hypothetical protein
MNMRYMVWRLERITKGIIRLLFIYPLLLLVLIPSTIHTGLTLVNHRLDRWRW